MNGILQWWLLEQQLMESKSPMQAAVDLLVQRGWIIAKLATPKRPRIWGTWPEE
jgi:hypothetical protein